MNIINIKLFPKGKTTLGKLPSGSLFLKDETLCLKTEYRTDNGAIEAFIVGSGEMFWGGTDNAKDQANMEVTEVEVVYFK